MSDTKYQEKLNAILAGLEISPLEKAELFGGLRSEFSSDILVDVAQYRGLIASATRLLRAKDEYDAALEAARIDFSDGLPGD